MEKAAIRSGGTGRAEQGHFGRVGIDPEQAALSGAAVYFNRLMQQSYHQGAPSRAGCLNVAIHDGRTQFHPCLDHNDTGDT